MNRRSATLSLLATLVTAVAPAHANADASAPANATLDPRLLGRWVHQSMINSGGGAGGFASFTTERTIEFGADGLVQQWVRSVGGGGSWSSQAGRRLEFAGRWQVRGNEIWVRPEGQPQPLRAGSSRLSGAYLVTEGRDGRTIWQR